MKITENHLIVLTQAINKNINSTNVPYKIRDLRLIPHYIQKLSDNEVFNDFFDILTLGNL